MLRQVGVSFDLYYDARKHKIKIYGDYIFSHFLQSFANLHEGNFYKTALHYFRIIKVDVEKRNFFLGLNEFRSRLSTFVIRLAEVPNKISDQTLLGFVYFQKIGADSAIVSFGHK